MKIQIDNTAQQEGNKCRGVRYSDLPRLAETLNDFVSLGYIAQTCAAYSKSVGFQFVLRGMSIEIQAGRNEKLRRECACMTVTYCVSVQHFLLVRARTVCFGINAVRAYNEAPRVGNRRIEKLPRAPVSLRFHE